MSRLLNWSTEFRVPGEQFEDPELKTVPYLVFQIKRELDYEVHINKDSVVEPSMNLNLAERNKLALQFMEIAVNEYVFRTPDQFYSFEKGKVYLVRPPDYGFTERDCPAVGDGVRLFVGSAKGIQIVEGPKGRGHSNAALIIDSKKAGFHMDTLMHVKIAEIVGHQNFAQEGLSKQELDKVNPVIRGITVETIYRGHSDKHFIVGVAEKNATTATFILQQTGKETSILEYFKLRYNIQLRYPNMNLLMARKNGRNSLIPMELCNVIRGQRVSISQQTPRQSQATTRNCALPPAERIQQTNQIIAAQALHDQENPYIVNAGLDIIKEPLKVTGRFINGPGIVFRERSASREETHHVYPHDGKWKFEMPFYRPARIDKWALYGLFSQNDHRSVNYNMIVEFGKRLMKEAAKKGVEIDVPADCRMVTVTKQNCGSEVEKLMRDAANAACFFVFFVTSDEVPAHPHIKYYERLYTVGTQDMKSSNMKKVVEQNKHLTLENVFLKTNMKNGGLNYSLHSPKGFDYESINKWFPPHRLVLGLGFSHSPFLKNFKGEPYKDVPSVIGYTANMRRNPFEFIGGFNFQPKGREECVVIGNILEDVLRVWKQEHEGQLPQELLIYRAGTSEGAYETILSYELPLIRGSLAKICGVYGHKITYICVSKSHNIRIFQEEVVSSFHLKNN
ncbi:hypothetical protein WR25_13800 [Diploscapter pachys]|uniref:PAZ domain-containing protein n=1 Tax=Diploscapter pachys TaxID=2018661 RepID=A0A2A2JHX0_9BILA|nr:hypothetical protein WR25_13800 [Diploscapter pachys]